MPHPAALALCLLPAAYARLAHPLVLSALLSQMPRAGAGAALVQDCQQHTLLSRPPPAPSEQLRGGAGDGRLLPGGGLADLDPLGQNVARLACARQTPAHQMIQTQ